MNIPAVTIKLKATPPEYLGTGIHIVRLRKTDQVIAQTNKLFAAIEAETKFLDKNPDSPAISLVNCLQKLLAQQPIPERLPGDEQFLLALKPTQTSLEYTIEGGLFGTKENGKDSNAPTVRHLFPGAHLLTAIPTPEQTQHRNRVGLTLTHALFQEYDGGETNGVLNLSNPLPWHLEVMQQWGKYIFGRGSLMSPESSQVWQVTHTLNADGQLVEVEV